MPFVPHRKPFSFILTRHCYELEYIFCMCVCAVRTCMCKCMHSFSMFRITIQICSDLNSCVSTIEIHAQLHIPCIILFRKKIAIKGKIRLWQWEQKTKLKHWQLGESEWRVGKKSPIQGCLLNICTIYFNMFFCVRFSSFEDVHF